MSAAGWLRVGMVHGWWDTVSSYKRGRVCSPEREVVQEHAEYSVRNDDDGLVL